MADNDNTSIKRVCIYIAAAIVIVISGLACYVGFCNIRATTFNNIEQRESLVNLYGCTFWGYPLTFFALLSGAALIGLLVIADKQN